MSSSTDRVSMCYITHNYCRHASVTCVDEVFLINGFAMFGAGQSFVICLIINWNSLLLHAMLVPRYVTRGLVET